MGELTIRKNRFLPAAQYTVKTKKPAGSGAGQKISGTARLAVSRELEKLMTRVDQAENHSRDSRRTLQTGESTLAEVQDRLNRAAELARKASGDGEMDRAAIQAELERLRAEIDRMVNSAAAGGAQLFLDEDMDIEAGADVLLYALLEDPSVGQEGLQALPDWLLQGLAADDLTPERLLEELGLDRTASGAELLAAIAGRPLEDSAAARLAVLYLGAVIADQGADAAPEEMLEGLRQLLERVSEGVSPDQALEELTGGMFSSLAEFQEQFISGAAPGLQTFLTNLLLPDDGSLVLSNSSILALLAGMKGMNLELLMGILTVSRSGGGSSAAGAEGGPQPEVLAGMENAAGAEAPARRMAVLQTGELQVMGRDLSGVSVQAETGALVVGGAADIVLQGTGQECRAVLLTGSGRVTLQNVNISVLSVDTPSASVVSTGENVLGEVRLRDGASLTLDGGGRLELNALRSGPSSSLRLSGGAVVVPGEDGDSLGTLAVPVLVDGPVSLAARADSVSSFGGKPLEPFDIVWKTFLPGWSSITSMELEGRQARMSLNCLDPARLWLDKGDPSHGYPAALFIRGRDERGRPRARYAYLHWNQNAKAFQETSMYPNPFTVMGGEPGKDWVYEEDSHTLRILSNQVSGLSGGAGTDVNQTPFSGRIALDSGIGKTELSLGGVACRVSSGRAFDLGCENDVTLVLQSGTRNHFESGAGCAGITLGNGTSLNIDCAGSSNSRTPDGRLTAAGGDGGAGIGRDSGSGQDQESRILIKGGVITATGTGGGAGIGAGKHGAMGSITVLGGTVTCTGGSGGGAGIGGALGAPVGDISIRGGTVSAEAAQHAAAIGAGVQGSCGDILITGTARIVKALGGNPGADIGACLFGSCGKVDVSGGASIGGAKLWTRSGISLRMGADTVTLPQFRLSSKVLRLDKLDLLTRESARAARKTIDADQRWVAQIQAVYSALYSQLEQGLCGAQQYVSAAGRAMRDTGDADTLLRDMKQSIPLQSSRSISAHGRQDIQDVRQLLW